MSCHKYVMSKLVSEDKRITIRVLRSLHEKIEKSIIRDKEHSNVTDFVNDAIREKLGAKN